ncbi:hypothetical protein HPB50_001629 [Hyalomma asiaticum]|uniref:Uncharacterized protein n=1 Tax=Hyalomma asiaticum TaxID=266040 RepID=A0ACB7SP45_HYAAI|nr:hypothetical protein HPB50_001629 [Hyalomma asiaticum]
MRPKMVDRQLGLWVGEGETAAHVPRGRPYFSRVLEPRSRVRDPSALRCNPVRVRRHTQRGNAPGEPEPYKGESASRLQTDGARRLFKKGSGLKPPASGRGLSADSREPSEEPSLNAEARLLCPTSTGVLKTKMLARLLPPVLLVLWAASESGRCDVPCPSYCVNSFAIFRPDDRRLRWIKGPDASSFVRIFQTVLNPGSSMTTVTVRIKGVDVRVPSNTKPMILEVLKRHPDLAQTIIDFLRNSPFFPSGRTPGGGVLEPSWLTPSVIPRNPGGNAVVPHPMPQGPIITPGIIPSFPEKPGFPSEVGTIKPELPMSRMPGLPAEPSIPGVTDNPGGPRIPAEPDIPSPVLIRRGVRFPDVARPFNYVIINGQHVNLPSVVRVLFTIRINGQPFVLPRDAPRLATFITQHPGQMTTITTILRQLGAVMTTNPSDLTSLISFVQSNPQSFHKVLPILITLGARPQKSPTGEIKTIVINGQDFPVRSVTPVRVVIHGRTYTIPADLDTILNQPGNIGVGELIGAFQKLRIPVKVDPATGNVVGVVMDVYKIPSELPAIVTYLQQHGMPAKVLSLLYNQFGIIPVRDSNNAVIAILFNDRRYPVQRQPDTAINIGGSHFTLPRDEPKLVRMLQDNRVPIEQFLTVIQQAGYKLHTGSRWRSSQRPKGFDVIELPVNIRLIVNINGVRYRVPKDLPRIVQVFRTINNPSSIEEILVSLRKMGVIVQRGAALLLPDHSWRPRVRRRNARASTRNDDHSREYQRPLVLAPDQIPDMMTFVRSSGPTAIQLLIRTLRSQGITVNMTPDGGDIVSIIILGQVYPVQGTGQAPPVAGGISDGRNVQVVIRGKTFMIPRDIGILRRSLPGFQYGELILALHRIGAMLEVDQRGNFYGMRIQGRLIKFAVIFRVNVMLDKSGHKYRVPLDLAELAQGLSSGRNWNWKIVRKVLYNSGVEVRGGSVGAPRAIGFQGKFYELHSGVKG